MHIKPDLWVIVDHTAADDTAQTTTTWTASPDVNLRKGGVPGAYVLQARGSPMQLKMFISSAPGATLREFTGSRLPFAGWQVVGRMPRAAPAIVIDQPARDSCHRYQPVTLASGTP